ncbi:SpoIIE family protein phosphatase [Oceanirhabdus seepicola]|uniref:SpoIIE family protein phosphatase n=1 Tax=Oceanirhabdus seepicola TaxID=2828781 RepID=A0A9J6P732_9CLOT|nr:SpoIIE family protein phosphatase [Oceanirhabdus seepicola]MCM1992698.1 SpoIIE family protein phosphatase [Oceanirhabdus seepicola]
MKKIKFENQIRVKITSAIILCSFILALLISFISIVLNYNFFEKEIKQKLELLPQNYSNTFNADFKMVGSTVNALKHSISVTFDLDKFKASPNDYVEEYEKIMDSTVKKSGEALSTKTLNGVQAVYFTINPELTGDVYEIWYVNQEQTDGFKKVDSDPNPQNPYIKDFYPDNESMHWYYNPIKKGEGVWSEPYKEVDLEKDIISYTEPIYKDDVLIGVVGMDIDINAMKNTIKNMKVYDTGYAFLLCDEYHFLIHPTYKLEDSLKTIENGSLEFLTKEIEKKESGVIKAKGKLKEKILGYSHLSNGWILVFEVPIYEVYSSMRIQMFVNFMTIFLSVFIIIPIALHIGKSISKPIVKITELIKNTSKFNFDDDKSLEILITNKDEIGVMAREMFFMRKFLKETGVHKAAKLQRSYLQSEFPILNKANMEVIYAPSKTVSGDFYHLERTNKNVVVGVLWDVSGKGVTAALSISAFNILFNKTLLITQNPIEILNCLNTRVSELLGNTYIAACCFSFDFEKKEAKIAGAGINEFIYSSKEGNYKQKIVKGPFLGMFEESLFDQQTIHFESGDKFCFLTDGLEFIFEEDFSGENSLKIDSITEFKNYIEDSLNSTLVDEEGIKDDCTLLAIEIK